MTRIFPGSMEERIEYEHPKATDSEKRTLFPYRSGALIEQWPDPEYEKRPEDIRPIRRKIFSWLRGWAYKNNMSGDAIPYRILTDAAVKEGGFAITEAGNAIRDAWKAGMARRFYKSERVGTNEERAPNANKSQNKGGRWAGVHYILYPETR